MSEGLFGIHGSLLVNGVGEFVQGFEVAEEDLGLRSAVSEYGVLDDIAYCIGDLFRGHDDLLSLLCQGRREGDRHTVHGL